MKMTIQKRIKMNELWMVKVGHPREVFKKPLIFILFGANKNLG